MHAAMVLIVAWTAHQVLLAPIIAQNVRVLRHLILATRHVGGYLLHALVVTRTTNHGRAVNNFGELQRWLALVPDETDLIINLRAAQMRLVTLLDRGFATAIIKASATHLVDSLTNALRILHALLGHLPVQVLVALMSDAVATHRATFILQRINS